MSDLPSAYSDVPSVSELTSKLSHLHEMQLIFLRGATPENIENAMWEDILVIAALRRSLDNTTGLIAMIAQRNLFCGMPILRFQIDTAMCLFARNLVTSVDDYVLHIMDGNKLNKYKDRNGKPRHDNYMHEQLSNSHDGASYIYSEGSGFVHFSQHHLLRVIDLQSYREFGTTLLNSVDDSTVGWIDDEIRGTIIAFIWATEAILTECVKWKNNRNFA